jgi:hypothetical protein
MNVKNIIMDFLLVVWALVFCPLAQGGTYFSWNAEGYPCDGRELPNPPFWTQEPSQRGYVVCGFAPEGNKFFEFDTVNRQGSAYTEIHPNPPFPITNILNKTLYLAYFFNFTRLGGLDIWYKSGDSADKGIEIVGSGIRWVISRGHWGNLAANRDNCYTVWGGNPTYHLNKALENYDILLPNQNGYNASNPIQLQYEKWHSAVMAVKVASDNTGSYTAWINGIKVSQYDNIITAANASPIIENIYMGGSIAQPAYDAPAHKRMFDALILTDNWDDIINGKYLVMRTPPFPPKGVRIINGKPLN